MFFILIFRHVYSLTIYCFLIIILSGCAPKKADNLYEAVVKGQVETAGQFINNGANVNAINSRKNTSLMRAVANGDVKMTKLLLVHGAQINAQNKAGVTALFIAIVRPQKKTELTKLLLDHGADPNITTFKLISPLHASIMEGSIDIAEILIEKGADINFRNAKGYAPIHIAILKREADILNLLINSGADLSLPINRLKPIDLAREINNYKAISLLEANLN